MPDLSSTSSPDAAAPPAAVGFPAVSAAALSPARVTSARVPPPRPGPAADAGRTAARTGNGTGTGPVLEAELAAARQEIAGLRVALTSRATIDQARGILIARYRISADGAFELLVRWSQDRNTKLRVIAETLVAMAQHGIEAPHADPSLARWLDQQLMEPSAGP